MLKEVIHKNVVEILTDNLKKSNLIQQEIDTLLSKYLETINEIVISAYTDFLEDEFEYFSEYINMNCLYEVVYNSDFPDDFSQHLSL